MHRKSDHGTSVAAAERVAKSCRTELQEAVYAKLIELGPMTDGELENLPEFSMYGPSTVRKRRSELYLDAPKRVEMTGERRNRMIVWRAVVA